MYRRYSMEYGLDSRIYRSTREIRCDIREIKEKIKNVRARLNPRTLLLDIINDERCGNPRELLISLEDALARAEEANLEMEELKTELFELEEELGETKCEMGM